MRNIVTPPDVQKALECGASVAVGISGGKDSQAMLMALVEAQAANRWPGRLFAIHAHLGRAEWPQSLPHCQALCDRLGVELVVVERARGDLVDRMVERMEKLEGTDKPFWPSSAARYCTSDMKREPINIHLRKFQAIISAEGIRSDESKSRQCKPYSQTRAKVATLSRLALTWNPIKDWSEYDVWHACGTSASDLERRRYLYSSGFEKEALDGWPCHPAYVFGNERVSCALCVLASKNDLAIGAKHNPQLAAEFIRLETRTGFTFKQGFSLTEVA